MWSFGWNSCIEGGLGEWMRFDVISLKGKYRGVRLVGGRDEVFILVWGWGSGKS